MKIVNYDKTTGKILGWYDSEIHGTYIPEEPEELNEDGSVKTNAVPSYYDITNIPTPNTEVSDIQWQTALNINANYYDGVSFSLKDFRTFEEIQTAKIIDLETDYSDANDQDIDYMNTTFQADKKSQDLIVSVLSAGSVPDGFFWLDKSNTHVTMTFADLQGLSFTILIRSQSNFVKYQNLKSDIISASSTSDLDAIVWQ
jgi:hypothetical protein